MSQRCWSRSFATYGLSRDALEAFVAPVYVAIGDRSSPDHSGEEAALLVRMFADFTRRSVRSGTTSTRRTGRSRTTWPAQRLG